MNVPELPEVEVIRRELVPLLEGAKILGIEVQDPRILLSPGAIQGKRVAKLSRWGKYLLFEFEGGGCLVLHLGMTGQLFFEGNRPSPKYERVRFMLSSGCLLFCDQRRFGKVLVCESKEDFLARLGVDPLSEAYTFEAFKALLRGKRRLKDFLLDQRKICGIGNIYASEILFRACLHPERPCESLTEEEKRRLFLLIPRLLEEAVRQKGTTIRDFRLPGGEEGGFQNVLMVYGESRCASCGGPVVRKVISSRSTYFCPHCQK
ncbi:MAG: bifunctional DNA-formamidopyrimidine glycosylase/DNA-(apurinic or apyrimidinic site) lyase [Candidatus Caldatribacteriaceae bacterium]